MKGLGAIWRFTRQVAVTCQSPAPDGAASFRRHRCSPVSHPQTSAITGESMHQPIDNSLDSNDLDEYRGSQLAARPRGPCWTDRRCDGCPSMPERRMISRTIATNAKLARVSLRANFLYLSCIPFIDRDGRMSGDEVTIKVRVVPLRDEIPLADIPALLAELVEQGLIACAASPK